MNRHIQRSISCLFLSFLVFFLQAQTTNIYTTSTTWTVPVGVSSIIIKVYGGAAGTGGQDCGAGCSNPAASAVGYVLATYSVAAGNIVGISPGGKGVNGSNSVTASGGGAGGVATYSVAYKGGIGGNTGPSGSSGGGGGGGAASIITISAVIKIVAGGAGGGGGMANSIGSGLPGNSSTSPNGALNAGGNGTTPGGDGGGGGGGGGGQFGSIGGAVHVAGAESAGNGGFLGGNSVSGASSVTTNANIVWANTGQIEITFTTLPVTWLSFTSSKEGNGVALNWSTASEQDTKDYTIQRSNNTTDWNDIGNVAAAGTSSTIQYYKFVDQSPATGLNYYRIIQRDLNGRFSYSSMVSFKFTDIARAMKVYPNPVVNGTTVISLKEAGIVELFNSTGAKVMEQEFKVGDHLLNVSALPKGTYYLKINNEQVLLIIQ